MRQKYIWEVGTPVLLVGYTDWDNRRGDRITKARLVLAGRLAEDWKPGQAILMQDGPMAGNLPAPKEFSASLVVGGSTRQYQGDAFLKYVSEFWKKGFIIGLKEMARVGTQKVWKGDEFGCLYHRIFEDVTGLVDELSELPSEGRWLALQHARDKIISHVDWRHGSEQMDYSCVSIDLNTMTPVRGR